MSLDVYLDGDFLQSAYQAGGIKLVGKYIDFLKGTNAKVLITDVVRAEIGLNSSGRQSR